MMYNFKRKNGSVRADIEEGYFPFGKDGVVIVNYDFDGNVETLAIEKVVYWKIPWYVITEVIIYKPQYVGYIECGRIPWDYTLTGWQSEGDDDDEEGSDVV